MKIEMGEKKYCPECTHEECPTCHACHNQPCVFFQNPFKECYQALLRTFPSPTNS